MGDRITTKEFLVLFLVFWMASMLVLSLEGPVNKVLCSGDLSHLQLTKDRPTLHARSEYTVSEHLSKYYLFLLILLSIYALNRRGRVVELKLAVCFFILGLTMYLSESNMIRGNVQPLLGALVIVPTLYFFLRSRRLLSLALFIAGLAIISTGAVLDISHDGRLSLPRAVLTLTGPMEVVGEERLDALGEGFLLLSAVVCYWHHVREFARGNLPGALGVLCASGLVAVGNGFLHYGYNPVMEVRLFGAAVTAVGLFGLRRLHSRLSPKGKSALLLDERFFFLFFLVFFLLLPAVYLKPIRDLVTNFFILPSIMGLACYLSVYHLRKGVAQSRAH